MRKWVLFSTALIFFPALLFAQSKTLSGFSEAAAKQESTVEEKFDGYLSAQNIQQYIKEISARPHHVGSPGGKGSCGLYLQ